MNDPAKTRLLDAAERLFQQHGFAAVKLRDIAHAAGLHHATFYHHVPGGKTELYHEAMQRSIQRHASALQHLIDTHDGDLRAQLNAVSDWLLEHGAGNHTRMISTDLPNLPTTVAQTLGTAAFRGLFAPLEQAFKAAKARGEIELSEEMMTVIAGTLLAALQAQQAAHAAYPGQYSARAQAHGIVDVLLDGMLVKNA